MPAQPIHSLTLKQGTGDPYVALFNEDGMPILIPLNPTKSVPIGYYLTNFQYTHSQEETGRAGDDGTAVRLDFEYDNATLGDIDSLQIGKNIFIQFGYVFYDGTFDCSPVLQFEIIRHEINLSPTTCKLTIVAKDITRGVIVNEGPVVSGFEGKTFFEAMEDGFDHGIPIIIVKA